MVCLILREEYEESSSKLGSKMAAKSNMATKSLTIPTPGFLSRTPQKPLQTRDQPRPQGLLAFQNGTGSGEDPGTPTSSPGSSRFSIWRRLGRRPWHTAESRDQNFQRGWKCIQNGG